MGYYTPAPVRFCDRCNQEEGERIVAVVLQTPGGDEWPYREPRSDEEGVDLCEDCLKALITWWENP